MPFLADTNYHQLKVGERRGGGRGLFHKCSITIYQLFRLFGSNQQVPEFVSDSCRRRINAKATYICPYCAFQLLRPSKSLALITNYRDNDITRHLCRIIPQ
jgi:hypothetical protein